MFRGQRRSNALRAHPASAGFPLIPPFSPFPAFFPWVNCIVPFFQCQGTSPRNPKGNPIGSLVTPRETGPRPRLCFPETDDLRLRLTAKTGGINRAWAHSPVPIRQTSTAPPRPSRSRRDFLPLLGAGVGPAQERCRAPAEGTVRSAAPFCTAFSHGNRHFPRFSPWNHLSA